MFGKVKLKTNVLTDDKQITYIPTPITGTTHLLICRPQHIDIFTVKEILPLRMHTPLCQMLQLKRAHPI